jgi:hypothetical protein
MIQRMERNDNQEAGFAVILVREEVEKYRTGSDSDRM